MAAKRVHEIMKLKTPQDKTLAIVMGGGAGTRLFPLTQKRAKPAVPLAAKYRLVDIPISNCLNGGFRQVYVLTQFNSESLNRHIKLHVQKRIMGRRARHYRIARLRVFQR
jgi:ADP-glucose pyrophosphorylase